MREKILAVIEKNSRIDIKDLAILLSGWNLINISPTIPTRGLRFSYPDQLGQYQR